MAIPAPQPIPFIKTKSTTFFEVWHPLSTVTPIKACCSIYVSFSASPTAIYSSSTLMENALFNYETTLYEDLFKSSFKFLK